jgi:mono/diheme cytochrome c family protein
MKLKFSKLFTKLRLAIFTLSLFSFLSNSAFAQIDGEKIFKGNCASCHKITSQKLVGPGLAGISNRWENKDNLISWIKNSQEYLKSNPGDAYAHNLFKEYNGSVMTAMALSTEEVEAVIEYINNPPVSAAPIVDTGAGAAVQGDGKDYSIYWIMGFLLVFIILIRVLTDVKTSLSKLAHEKEGTEYVATAPLHTAILKWMQNHKKYTAIIILVLTGWGLTQGWYALKGIGVYQGYAPEQPIKFSHKIHAGDNGISCQYCHSSAEKGKHSGIPSVNICMNCHAGIQEGKRWGKEEIAKIYEAAGYDPEAGAYTKPKKPIKWIRIHNLPDHAYFNHSQHVIVGKVECQTCHGKVEEIDYPMYQHAELTMGWCVNCHRETDVQMEGNGYYDDFKKQLKEVYKNKDIENFKVNHIGGIECAKCHY